MLNYVKFVKRFSGLNEILLLNWSVILNGDYDYADKFMFDQ